MRYDAARQLPIALPPYGLEAMVFLTRKPQDIKAG